MKAEFHFDIEKDGIKISLTEEEAVNLYQQLVHLFKIPASSLPPNLTGNNNYRSTCVTNLVNSINE